MTILSICYRLCGKFSPYDCEDYDRDGFCKYFSLSLSQLEREEKEKENLFSREECSVLSTLPDEEILSEKDIPQECFLCNSFDECWEILPIDCEECGKCVFFDEELI